MSQEIVANWYNGYLGGVKEKVYIRYISDG